RGGESGAPVQRYAQGGAAKHTMQVTQGHPLT
ncbi:unnamed protein product, partial [marine sediment metagenome]